MLLPVDQLFKKTANGSFNFFGEGGGAPVVPVLSLFSSSVSKVCMDKSGASIVLAASQLALFSCCW
jgi:hypothetical protein